MAVTTVTQICNLALSRIGARRLSAYESDTSVEGTSCRLHYELALDGLLRRHQWDFAKDSKRLTKLPAAVAPQYPAAWQLPADCVRILGASTEGKTITDYARHGRLLLCENYATVDLEYISNAVPVSQWDSLFVEALALALAKKICEDIVQNPQKMAEISSELESLALPTAQTADAREANSGEGFGLADLIGQSALRRVRRSRISSLPGSEVGGVTLLPP
jgi:hypothetical protein